MSVPSLNSKIQPQPNSKSFFVQKQTPQSNKPIFTSGSSVKRSDSVNAGFSVFDFDTGQNFNGIPLNNHNSNPNLNIKQQLQTNRMYFERGNTESSTQHISVGVNGSGNGGGGSVVRAPSMDKQNYPIMNPNIIMKSQNAFTTQTPYSNQKDSFIQRSMQNKNQMSPNSIHDIVRSEIQDQMDKIKSEILQSVHNSTQDTAEQALKSSGVIDNIKYHLESQKGEMKEIYSQINDFHMKISELQNFASVSSSNSDRMDDRQINMQIEGQIKEIYNEKISKIETGQKQIREVLVNVKEDLIKEIAEQIRLISSNIQDRALQDDEQIIQYVNDIQSKWENKFSSTIDQLNMKYLSIEKSITTLRKETEIAKTDKYQSDSNLQIEDFKRTIESTVSKINQTMDSQVDMKDLDSMLLSNQQCIFENLSKIFFSSIDHRNLQTQENIQNMNIDLRNLEFTLKNSILQFQCTVEDHEQKFNLLETTIKNQSKLKSSSPSEQLKDSGHLKVPIPQTTVFDSKNQDIQEDKYNQKSENMTSHSNEPPLAHLERNLMNYLSSSSSITGLPPLSSSAYTTNSSSLNCKELDMKDGGRRDDYESNYSISSMFSPPQKNTQLGKTHQEILNKQILSTSNPLPVDQLDSTSKSNSLDKISIGNNCNNSTESHLIPSKEDHTYSYSKKSSNPCSPKTKRDSASHTYSSTTGDQKSHLQVNNALFSAAGSTNSTLQESGIIPQSHNMQPHQLNVNDEANYFKKQRKSPGENDEDFVEVTQSHNMNILRESDCSIIDGLNLENAMNEQNIGNKFDEYLKRYEQFNQEVNNYLNNQKISGPLRQLLEECRESTNVPLTQDIDCQNLSPTKPIFKLKLSNSFNGTSSVTSLQSSISNMQHAINVEPPSLDPAHMHMPNGNEYGAFDSISPANYSYSSPPLNYQSNRTTTSQKLNESEVESVVFNSVSNLHEMMSPRTNVSNTPLNQNFTSPISMNYSQKLNEPPMSKMNNFIQSVASVNSSNCEPYEANWNSNEDTSPENNSSIINKVYYPQTFPHDEVNEMSVCSSIECRKLEEDQQNEAIEFNLPQINTNINSNPSPTQSIALNRASRNQACKKKNNVLQIKVLKKVGQMLLSSISQKECEEDQIVYQLDDNGFLMDQLGNYILDDQGQPIKLSNEHIEYLRSANMLQEP